MGIIEPDNYVEVMGELRTRIFGDRKAKGEPGYVEDPKFEVDPAKMNILVETIFREVQTDHCKANFYAELCAQIIRLELIMKGL